MIFASALRLWVLRLLFSMLVIHGLWWALKLDQRLLGVLKIVMESALPFFISEVERVWRAANGGWMMATTIKVGDAGSLGVLIDHVLLTKCVSWIPTCLGMVFATSSRLFHRVMIAGLACIVASAVMIGVSAAGNIALAVNPNATIWSDGVPTTPRTGLSVEPFADWYFFLVTTGLYFNLNVAALAMPVVIWVSVCRCDIEKILLGR